MEKKTNIGYKEKRKNKLMRKRYLIVIMRYLYEIIGTIIGSFIMAFAVSLFLLPNQLSSGGVSGIATILYYLLQTPMGTSIIVINIPLFILAIFKLGKEFFLKAVIGTISLSLFIDLLNQFEPLTTDRFLACIYGGIIIGIGTAIILKVKSSTGGTDLSSYIIKEYRPSVQMGRAIVVIDIVIISLNVFFFNEIEIGLYSAITIYIMGKVIDIIFEGVDFTKLILIVSDKNDKIAEEIGDKVRRGSTALYGKGMHTNEEKIVLMTAAARRDVSRIKEIALKIDPRSFIIVTNSREVLGLGFKK